jgi:DNA-binding NarL/FixJ family response regulator
MGEVERIAVACCNRLLREAITRILTKRPYFEVTAVDCAPSSVVGAVLECKPDILVLDSLETLVAVQSSEPSLAEVSEFVLVAMEDDHDHFLRAIQHGVRGYVLRDASAADVLNAIRAVAQGEAACPPAYVRILFDCVADLSDSSRANAAESVDWTLTRREQQLVPLIGSGHTNKEIASQLNISEQTVKNHIHRMMRKMQVSSRLEICKTCQPEVPIGSTKAIRYSAGYLPS